MNIEKQMPSSNGAGYGPLVSVIIPIYNAEQYIKQTIRSVQEQTYRNWELLIIDNCSNDNTQQLISVYESSKIRIFRTERNSGGPAVPRNIGIKNANGEYLAFLDADDLWKNTKLEVQLRYLEKEDFVCSLASTIDTLGNVIRKAECVDNKHYEFCELVNKCRIFNSSVIVSRDKFSSVLFDEDPLLNGVEDFNAYMTYSLLYGPIFLIGESLIEYRVLPSSLGRSISGKERLAKSSYSLSKVVLASGKYDCYFYGMVGRLLMYVKSWLINKKGFGYLRNIKWFR